MKNLLLILDRTSRQRISPFVRKQIYETLLDILGFKMLKLNACYILRMYFRESNGKFLLCRRIVITVSVDYSRDTPPSLKGVP